MMLPLEGVKVLDLTRLLPGPYCTMLLADMGAEVIKIEQPHPRWEIAESGLMGPLPEAPAEKRREIIQAYRFVDRNKKSIALDLKTPQGKKIFYQLAEGVDVVVEEFRPGVTKRLGVDYETVKQINPKIIYCAITGFGQDGPYSQFPGHDPNYLATAGVLGLTGTADGQHAYPGVPIADLGGGGMHGTMGILLALIARQRTGQGQFVDISMTDGLISWLAVSHEAYFSTGWQPKLGTPSHVYETKDGKYLCIAPAEPWFWERVCRALDLEEFIPDHQKIFGHSDRAKQIISRFAEVFRTKTRDEWLEVLREADTCVAPVYTMEEVFSDPQVLHRQMVTEVEHPSLGKIKHVGIAIKLSETPGKIRCTAPLPGEHTEEILQDLGYTKQQLEELRQVGTII